jgi:F-type H+-transporting ATPase subunit c
MDLAVIHTITQAVVAAAEQAGDVAAAVSPYKPIGVGLAAGGAVLGVGIGIGKLVAAALEGSARQPEMMGKLQTMMILGIAFAEALALIALLVVPFII